MFDGVGERLLRRADHGVRGLDRHLAALAVDLERDRPAVGEEPQRLLQREGVLAQGMDGSSRLGDALDREGPCSADGEGRLVVAATALERVGHVQLHGDGRQGMAEHVVNLAGDPAPLRQSPLPGLGLRRPLRLRHRTPRVEQGVQPVTVGDAHVDRQADGEREPPGPRTRRGVEPADDPHRHHAAEHAGHRDADRRGPRSELATGGGRGDEGEHGRHGRLREREQHRGEDRVGRHDGDLQPRRDPPPRQEGADPGDRDDDEKGRRRPGIQDLVGRKLDRRDGDRRDRDERTNQLIGEELLPHDRPAPLLAGRGRHGEPVRCDGDPVRCG